MEDCFVFKAQKNHLISKGNGVLTCTHMLDAQFSGSVRAQEGFQGELCSGRAGAASFPWRSVPPAPIPHFFVQNRFSPSPCRITGKLMVQTSHSSRPLGFDELNRVNTGQLCKGAGEMGYLMP